MDTAPTSHHSVQAKDGRDESFVESLGDGGDGGNRRRGGAAMLPADHADGEDRGLEQDEEEEGEGGEEGEDEEKARGKRKPIVRDVHAPRMFESVLSVRAAAQTVYVTR